MPLPAAYADADDFAAFYPSEAEAADEDALTALLSHASRVVEEYILAACDITDNDTAAALQAAVCHQVAAWLEVGDSHDLAGYARGVGVSLGDLSISGQPAPIAPRAIRVLKLAGLTTPYGGGAY